MIDVDALARPIIDLVDTVGTGAPSASGPDVGIRIATDALEIAYQLGSAALSELASSQSSSTALTAAVTKTEQTQTSTRNLADRGTDIAGVVDEATTSVYAGMTELGEILQSFLTLAIKAGPTLMTPTGQLMLLSPRWSTSEARYRLSSGYAVSWPGRPTRCPHSSRPSRYPIPHLESPVRRVVPAILSIHSSRYRAPEQPAPAVQVALRSNFPTARLPPHRTPRPLLPYATRSLNRVSRTPGEALRRESVWTAAG